MTTIEAMPTAPGAGQGQFVLRSFGALPPRVAHTMTILADDRVLLAGSARTLAAAQSASLFNATMTSGAATASMGAARFDHTATLLFDGRVLVCGGGGDASQVPGVAGISTAITASAELFNP
jgi:hypothetical protein